MLENARNALVFTKCTSKLLPIQYELLIFKISWSLSKCLTLIQIGFISVILNLQRSIENL